MDSSLVRKIAKAKDYAEQPDRIQITNMAAGFRGKNGNYAVSYEVGNWDCSCHYFAGHGTCSHTMALQIVLDGMVPNLPVVSPPQISVETAVEAPVLAS